MSATLSAHEETDESHTVNELIQCRPTNLWWRQSVMAFWRTEFGFNVDPNARLFVSLGRLVRQKGVDILADVAEWLLSTYPEAQLLVIGPPADGFGYYAQRRLEALADLECFQGRLVAKCQFIEAKPSLKWGADFCLMPSRDEPFGYVDIEFAWRGAVIVGAQSGVVDVL